MSPGSVTGSARGSKISEDIFKVLGNNNRELVTKKINKDELSLGMVDPTTGR
jgi:hypothetical protein